MKRTEPRQAHGSPTKDFFVRMITRDISLTDCILDLVDNAIDGARRIARSEIEQGQPAPLQRFKVSITLTPSKLEIRDNCGGISLSDAIDYAFHFGRRRDAPQDINGSIGLYGIGMKRAIFKMGRYAKVESVTSGDKFSVIIDVDTWLKKPEDNWDFDIESLESTDPAGTRITVEKLHESSAVAFADRSFLNILIRTMARDYAFVMNKGIEIEASTPTEVFVVPKYDYKIKEGDVLAPAILEYDDDEVKVRLVAGLLSDLPVDIPDEFRPDETDVYGWYVICNDRLVVAGDKSAVTVWGNNDDFPGWHPQYNGFGGFTFMTSKDASKLPWRTTKREVDVDNPVYKRALVKMKEMTRQFIKYSNDRKNDPEAAKEMEKATPTVNVLAVRTTAPVMKLPDIVNVPGKEKTVTVCYPKSEEQVKRAKDTMGDFTMSNRELGSKAFDYYFKHEVENKK